MSARYTPGTTAVTAPAVLYFTQRYWPGSLAIPVHAELLRALTARGWPAAIVTMAPANQRQPVVVAPDGDLPVFRVSTRRHALDRLVNRYARRRYDYPYLLTTARYLRPWLRQQSHAARPPILQVESAYPGGALIRRAAAGTLARGVVTLHGGDVLVASDGSYGKADRPVVRRELTKVFAWASAIRAMSPLLARRAIELGCPAEKVVVIPPNLSQVFYPAEPLLTVRTRARTAVLAELGLPPDTRLLLTSGRALPIKGFDTLVSALPAILARQPNTHLVIYGPDRGETLTRLRAQLAASSVAGHVHLLGEIPFASQNRWLAAADLGVVPSLLDGFNKFGAEAAAHGTPLVVTTAAGIADYVREYDAGQVVPPGDADALAAAIGALLTDQTAWHAASAAAPRLADECRTEQVADALTTVYERITGKTERA